MIPGVLVPCVVCGVAGERTRCPEHQAHRARRTRGTFRERGYDGAWDRLSRAARRRQTFCTRCSSIDHLSTDHTPEAWWRRERGLPIRLRDVQVLCAGCQVALGSARPGSARYVAWENTR